MASWSQCATFVLWVARAIVIVHGHHSKFVPNYRSFTISDMIARE